MSITDLDLVPSEIASKSISKKELVLPLKEALEAINFLEDSGYQLLGWEGCVKYQDGTWNFGNAVLGTESLDKLSISEAAKFCRDTIIKESIHWETKNLQSNEQLHFCIIFCT